MLELWRIYRRWGWGSFKYEFGIKWFWFWAHLRGEKEPENKCHVDFSYMKDPKRYNRFDRENYIKQRSNFAKCIRNL